MTPLWLLKYLPNMPASHLAIYTDFRGPNNSLTMREAAANAAIGEAHEIIRRGSADLMLVGATGTRLHPMKMGHAAGQEELAAGDGDPAAASRPFDRDRRGVVLGEGAGAIVLEELPAAQARGATIYGEVLAAATSCVADRHLLARRDRALQNVLEAVLAARRGERRRDWPHPRPRPEHADLRRGRIAGDPSGLRRAGARRVPVVAAKSHFGNFGAAGGMVELIASLLAMKHGRLFPILNYATPDPECPVAESATATSRPATASSTSTSPRKARPRPYWCGDTTDRGTDAIQRYDHGRCGSPVAVLVRRQQRLLEAAVQTRLVHQPTTPTKAVRKLRPNPLAQWELRAGELLALYNVEGNEVVLLVVGRKVGNKLIVEGREFHGHQDNPAEPV